MAVGNTQISDKESTKVFSSWLPVKKAASVPGDVNAHAYVCVCLCVGNANAKACDAM